MTAQPGSARIPLRRPEGAERRFGKLTLLVKLGWGGMADVYLATDGGARAAPIVVKRLKPDLAYDPEYLAMFKDEARLALRLDHPNIVRAYETGEIDGQPFLTMEFLNGQPLDYVLDASSERRLSEREVLHVMDQLLAGMHYAHELRDEKGAGLEIVHRDVSPHNVFVTYDGNVKLVDFGIAKSRMKAQHTTTGVVKGKIAYMAPEQALANVVDKRADVFAAGVILWELIASKPFWGDKPDVQILKTMTFGELPSPDEALPEASPELRRILAKALSITPDLRYASAGEFRRELADYAGTLGKPAEPRAIGASIGALAAEKRRAVEEILDRELGASWRDAAEPARMPPLSLRGAPSAVVSASATPIPLSPAGDLEFGEVAPPEKPASAALHETGDGQALPLAPLPEAKPRRVWPLAALGAVALVGAGAFGLRGLRAAQTHAAPAAPRAPETAPASADIAPQNAPPEAALAPQASSSATAVANTISVRVTTAPSSAVVTLDGTRLAENPFTARFPRDGLAHKLAFDAPGYVHRAELVVFDKDVDVDVALVALRGAKLSGAGGAQTAAPASSRNGAGPTGGLVDERDPWPAGKPKR